jgi:DNA-binding NtrC family response regulator
MLTASNAIADATQAYNLGATSFFVKPFDFTDANELSRTLTRVLSKASGSHGAIPENPASTGT